MHGCTKIPDSTSLLKQCPKARLLLAGIVVCLAWLSPQPWTLGILTTVVFSGAVVRCSELNNWAKRVAWYGVPQSSGPAVAMVDYLPYYYYLLIFTPVPS